MKLVETHIDVNIYRKYYFIYLGKYLFENHM